MKTQKTIQHGINRAAYSGSLALTLATMIATAMFALPTVAWSQTGEWIVYNTSNSGLPFNLILGLACDDRGNVWIGTGDPFGNGRGLAKFDGENWTVYNTSNSGLPYNAVRALAPDTQGGIWIGTHGALGSVARGLAHFDGGNWMVYNASNSGLPHNNVGALTLDAEGNLWVGTDGGLARFDGVNWGVYTQANSGLPHNRVIAIAIDDQGNKWIGTYGGGLAKFDGTSWETFDRTNSGLPQDNVYAIAIDAQGNKWIGTAVHISGPVGGGLAKFDGQNWTVYNKANSVLPHNDVYTVVIDTDGSVWTGSGEHIPASVGGLTRFDGVDWTVYDKNNSEMPYNLVYAIAIDAGGTKWIGSINFDEPGGLVAYRALPTVDFNGDGMVDCADMCIMVDHWGEDYPLCDIGPTPFGDGIVDIQDLIVLAEHLFEEVLPAGLVAYWKFDATEGDIAHDSAGVNDGVVNGEPLWQPAGGQVDGALQFDGIDDYVETEFALSPADGPFSVFAWIKGGAPGQAIVAQQAGTNWLVANAPDGALMTDLKSAGRLAKSLTSAVVITDGTWHRVGLVWDGTNRILYVDDIEVARDTQTNLLPSAGGLYIGAGKNLESGSLFSGLIDDVRIYNRAVQP